MNEQRAIEKRWLILILFVLGAGVLLYRLVTGNPGGEPVRPEPTAPSRPSVLPPGQLGVFAHPWDSEAEANWPVTPVLAKMSAAAYLPNAEASLAFKALGFAKTTPVVVGSQAAYVAQGGEVAVVVFRGTDGDIGDWFANLDMLSKQTAHGGVHSGFANGYASLSTAIIAPLQGTAPKYVWITGHSLGGALALMCAYDFLEKGKPTVSGLITFGQPMVAKRPLADYLNQKLVGRYANYVNEADIVPRVPPTYAHCGSLVWFKDGLIYRSPAIRPVFGARGPKEHTVQEEVALPPLTVQQFEAKKQEIRIKRTPKMRADGQIVVEGSLPLLVDHSIEKYVDKISRLAPAPLEPAQIKAEVSFEIKENVSKMELTLRKGQVVELRIANPPMQDIVQEVTIAATSELKHPSDRNRPDLADSGEVMVGSGWYCVYVQALGKGDLSVRYRKGNQKQDVLIRIDAR